MKKLALVAAIVLSTSAAHAEEDGQLWLAPIVQAPIAGKLRGYLEFQARAREDGKQLDRLIVRPALNYGLGHGFSAWLGYGYMPFTRRRESKLYPEHRVWEQLAHMAGVPETGQVQNRLRFEQRFIDSADHTAFRLRYMVRTVVRPKSWSGFGLAVSDEIFVNLNSASPTVRTGFDQNRFTFGIQYAVSKVLVLEPAYLAMTQWRPNREILVGHTGLLFVWITL
jgi:hypothetical protein